LFFASATEKSGSSSHVSGCTSFVCVKRRKVVVVVEVVGITVIEWRRSQIFLNMPHRATYFFPRQFPERGLDESSKQRLDHEKRKLVNSIKSSDTTFAYESDAPKKPTPIPTPAAKDNDDVVFSSGKQSAVSDLFTGADKFRTKQKQIAAFCDWLIDKKKDINRPSHRLRTYPNDEEEEEDERELLLPPPPPPASAAAQVVKDAVDRSFDRQVSLPRLSSGSSYAGSLFTLDGTATFSSDVTKDETSSFQVFTEEDARKRKEEEENVKLNTAQKYKESYYLQLTLAQRLSFLASLASEPVLALDAGPETWDAESVSYRLWVRTYYGQRNETTLAAAVDYRLVTCSFGWFSGEWMFVVHGQDIWRILQHTGDESIPVGDVQWCWGRREAFTDADGA